jgi:diguanylate cyclase (GGDEF)-like protein
MTKQRTPLLFVYSVDNKGLIVRMSKLRLSIAHKLMLSLGILIILSFGSLVSAHLIKVYQVNLRESELIAETQMREGTQFFNHYLDQTVAALDTLQASMMLMRRDGIQNREYVVQLLHDKLEGLPQIMALYTLWEPDAFDGQDALHRGKNKYDDDTGRFLPYVMRDNGEIQLHPLEYYNDPIKGSYYQTPKQTKTFSIIEPYKYEVDGKSFLMTSLVLPLLDGQGNYLGIVGADVSLNEVQQQLESFRPLGGYASIITADNHYVANGSDPSLVMQPYRNWEGGASFEALKANAPGLQYTPAADGSGTVMRMIYPISVKNNVWYMEIVVPKQNMLQSFYMSIKESILIMLLALFFMTLAMGILVRKIILNNIQKVVQATSNVAMGLDNNKLDIRTNDEFGHLAKHFNHMIDQRNEAERLIEYQATHDLLTGLPNRFAYQLHWDARDAQDTERAEKTAMLYIDLDRFKLINDSQDYAMGDQLLKQMAERIVAEMNYQGRLFRFSSDEFILLMEDVKDIAEVEELAEQLLAVIAEPIRQQDRIFYITASIGMSIQHQLYPGMCEQLLKEADTAMYVAKKERNTCKMYTTSMNNVPKKELLLENGMLQALEHGQFMLYYQPKINVQTGSINGAEALLRWNHPDYGMVSPLEFIPIAERTGFIIALGEWVLYTACQQIKEWERMGLQGLTVSVNMSMIQFQQKQIVHTIERIIADAGIRPEQIELEITESIFMDNQEYTLRILHELQQMGVKLSLDDFGTGYSSLSYLQNIPIDTLKLDKTFINDIVGDYKKQMIFKSVVVIAHHLNLRVVTEGVETEDQLEIIRKHQCDAVQGYIFSPPVPPPRFVQLYMENQAQRDE